MPTTTSQNDPKGSAGPISALYNLSVTYPVISFVFALFAGAATGAIAGYGFIESKVNSVAEKRLEPYEQLFSALSLNQGEEYSDAAEEFQKLINLKEFESLSSSSKELAYDGLTLAIANSNDPAKYQVSLRKIQKRLSESIQETAWRLHHVGWILMRTGKLSDAKEYFSSAIDSYKSKREYSASVDPSRGLLYIALFENKPDEAFALGQGIKELRPSQYKTNSDLIADIRESQKSQMFDSFNARYEEVLDGAVNQYVSMLITAEAKVER